MIAADDGGGRQLPDAIDDLVRIRAIADQIAQNERVIVLAGGGERRVERLDVRVDVAENQVFHQYPIHSSRCSTTSGTGRVASMRTCASA